jgi:hypothetical protein
MNPELASSGCRALVRDSLRILSRASVTQLKFVGFCRLPEGEFPSLSPRAPLPPGPGAGEGVLLRQDWKKVRRSQVVHLTNLCYVAFIEDLSTPS